MRNRTLDIYDSTHPTDSAGRFMFWGCQFICACVCLAEAFFSGRAVNLVYSECEYIYALCGHLLIVCYYFHAGVSKPLNGSSCC